MQTWWHQSCLRFTDWQSYPSTACGAVELGTLLCRQLAPLIDSLSELDAPLSAASPVQEAPLAQYQQALRQVCEWHRLPV